MFYRQHCAYDVNSAQKLFRLSCWPAGSATTFGASSALKSAVKLSPTEFRAMKVASGAHFLDAAHPCPSQKLSQIMSNHSAYSTLSDFIWLPDFIMSNPSDVTWFYLIFSCGHVASCCCHQGWRPSGDSPGWTQEDHQLHERLGWRRRYVQHRPAMWSTDVLYKMKQMNIWIYMKPDQILSNYLW